MARELRPQDDLLLPHDADPIEYVAPSTWDCRWCGPGTMQWRPIAGEQIGRCLTCGAKVSVIELDDKQATSWLRSRRASR